MKRILAAAMLVCTIVSAQTVDPSLYSGLIWRNVGPFRGGRVAAVTGAIGQPGVYYMGLPLGGVWKTTNAGVTWNPIFDDIKEASSVGAIEAAPSDPNIIYVGMGDLITGGGINEGNGVYKSTDAGKTWTHLGLDNSRQIPSILVDPKDPNLVMIAAQGDVHAKSEMRGVYRSTDGGKTWTKTLYVDDITGAQKITWAPDNPKVMLATTVRHYQAPPGTPGVQPGQPAPSGTMLFKSTDEGITWTELKGNGLPELGGRTSVAIAQHTNSQRMFLVGNNGLYRSDDGGDHWKRMAENDRRAANGQGGYNCGVYVNSKNPDIVYVVNTCSYISKDGGNTFTGFKGAPGGDDPQQFWFDPNDADRIFLGSDQGATISMDGGQSWSSWYNQPTGQVYHISVDNRFPYWIYATQQDSGSIGTSSRGNLGEITPLDWTPHPGYEFGSIVADPLNPNITYAGGPGGGIVKVIHPSEQWVNISPNIDSTERLRHVGNQPIMFNPSNPQELLAGFQCLMATTDGGVHWTKLSPDLGVAKDAKPTAEVEPETDAVDADADEEGEVEQELVEMRELDSGVQQGPVSGGSIESFSVSTVDQNIIWVGTSNGLVKLTKDHGKTWEDVSIADIPHGSRADISAIDASHHEAGTAYIAVDNHSTGDYTPCFYRTKDFGKSWTKIVDGLPTDLPSGSFSRVIRADTVRKGLLFAGTESFVYVSFDDGDHWQSLALNQPNTSYRDMVVKDNDLVVGTYGRGFWILDDISPLRQIKPEMKSDKAILFKPGIAYRVRRNVNGDTPMPPEVPHALNAPSGALIYYHLQTPSEGKVAIEISDSSGRVVRHLSSDPIKRYESLQPAPDYWFETPSSLPITAGTHRVNWNLRCDDPQAFSRSYSINATPGLTPLSPEGPLCPPGTYTVRLSVGGKTYSQKLTVWNDPRSPVTSDELKAQTDLQMELYDSAELAMAGYQQAAEMRASIAEAVKGMDDTDLVAGVKDMDGRIAALQGGAGGGRRFGGGGGGGGPRPNTDAPPVPSFSQVNGALLRQLESLDSGDMAPTPAMMKVCEAALHDFEEAVDAWKEFNAKTVPEFNIFLAKYKVKSIAPAPDLKAEARSK